MHALISPLISLVASDLKPRRTFCSSFASKIRLIQSGPQLHKTPDMNKRTLVA
jgi:hypothetical protein